MTAPGASRARPSPRRAACASAACSACRCSSPRPGCCSPSSWSPASARCCRSSTAPAAATSAPARSRCCCWSASCCTRSATASSPGRSACRCAASPSPSSPGSPRSPSRRRRRRASTPSPSSARWSPCCSPGSGWAGRDLFEPGTLPFLLMTVVAASNALVAAFNLLPGLPLDGGRVLRSVLWRLTGDPDRATRAAAWAGRVVALVVVPVLLLVRAAGRRAQRRLDRHRPVLRAGRDLRLRRRHGHAAAGAAQAAPARGPRSRRWPAAPSPSPRTCRSPRRCAGRRRPTRAASSSSTAPAGPRAVVSEAAVLATPEERRPWVPVGERGPRPGRRAWCSTPPWPASRSSRRCAARRRPSTSSHDGGGFRVLAAQDVAAVLSA